MVVDVLIDVLLQVIEIKQNYEVFHVGLENVYSIKVVVSIDNSPIEVLIVQSILPVEVVIMVMVQVESMRCSGVEVVTQHDEVDSMLSVCVFLDI